MNWQELLAPVYPVLASALVSVLVLLIRAGQRWIESKISGDRYLKAASIVMDSILAAAQQIGPQWAAMMADGKLTATEKAILKASARQIAGARLKDLRGFALAEGSAWIEHQMDISLGKLEVGLFGHPAGGQTIGPDEPATE